MEDNLPRSGVSIHGMYHDTQPLDIDGKIYHVDTGVATIVQLMNKIPGVSTIASCQGSDTRSMSYVSMALSLNKWEDVAKVLLDRLIGKIKTFDLSCENKLRIRGPEPILIVRWRPERQNEIESAILDMVIDE